MTKERMKGLSPRRFSLLAILALFVTATFSGAQQTRLQTQQVEPKIAEVESQKFDPELFRSKLPKACERIRPDVQTHDVNDLFNPPGNPLVLSPALTAFASGVGRPLKGYDNKSIDTWFYDSFKLRSCRVCYATVEIGVKHDSDQVSENGNNNVGHETGKLLWSFYNDNITIGGAPFNQSVLRVLSMDLWPPLNPTPPLTNPKVMNFALPTTALNNYLMSGSTPPASLDMVVQDDTDVDYITLKIWYY